MNNRVHPVPISPQSVLLVAVMLLLALPAGAADGQSVPLLSGDTHGYRVREYRWDPILRQRWAILEDPAHPERPYRSALADIPQSALLSNPASPQARVYTPPSFVVRTGDTVALWSEEHNLRMELAAVAESNAAIGDHIQLRVKGIGANGDWHATGIVRGSGDVEMER